MGQNILGDNRRWYKDKIAKRQMALQHIAKIDSMGLYERPKQENISWKVPGWIRQLQTGEVYPLVVLYRHAKNQPKTHVATRGHPL